MMHYGTLNEGQLPPRCRLNGDLKWRHLGVTIVSAVSAPQVGDVTRSRMAKFFLTGDVAVWISEN